MKIFRALPAITLALALIVPLVAIDGCASVSQPQAADYYNQGVALGKEGRYDEAISFYDRTIETDPDYADAYISRGHAYIETKRYEPAIADYTRAIELAPGEAVAYNGRGAAYIYTKRYQSAESDFHKAAEIDPGFVQAQKNLGDVINILGQATLNNTYGVNLAQTGNFKEACASFSKAIEIYPYSYPAYTNLGAIFTVSEQYEFAITAFNSAININPGYAPAYSGRGRAYIFTESYREAANDLDRALEIEDPDEATDWNNKGIALEQLGELTGAAAAYNTALALDPDNEGIKSNIAAVTGVAQAGGKPAGIKGRYLPPQRYWVGPKAEERTTETEFAPYTEPPAVPGWGTTGGTIVVPESLVGKWTDDSPRYGYIQSQQADTWNYNAVLNIVEEVCHTGPMQTEQPSTFSGTLRIKLASVTGPITSSPSMMSYYNIGDTSEFPVSGKHLNTGVELYVGPDTLYLEYDGHDFMGGTTQITRGDGLRWAVSLWLRRNR